MFILTIRRNFILLVAIMFLIGLTSSAYALDTDAYQVNSQQNTTMLLDNSGSMQYGIYESGADYADMFEKLKVKSGVDSSSAILDTATPPFNRYEIYCIQGNVKMVLSNEVPVTGDAGAVPMTYSDGITWNFSDESIKSTHTSLKTGSIVSIAGEGETPRLSISESSTVFFDGAALPYGLSIAQHNYQTLHDESLMDMGFAGLLQAPGYAFSGFSAIDTNVKAESGDTNIYFFVTGNWLYYQMLCNLDYEVAKDDGSRPWQNESVELENVWLKDDQANIDCPAGDIPYDNDNITRTLTIANATQIRLHFSQFDLSDDEVRVYQGPTAQNKYEVITYTMASPPSSSSETEDTSDWSVVIPGDTVTLVLYTDNSDHDLGYKIDKAEYTTPEGSTYKIKSRFDVAKGAIDYVLEHFVDDINWGFAFFDNPDGDGANVQYPLNPTSSDINRQNIQAQVKTMELFPRGGTPLGEALQDVFLDGYYGNNGLKNAGLKKAPCSRNYAVVMSDGFPSDDSEWERISGVNFSEYSATDFTDGGFTYDPTYDPTTRDYYDAVAHWMYTHSWIDKEPVTNPLTSYDNIITHHIAFGTVNPLLEYAASQSGGIYLTAYNESQLIHALYSVAQMIGQSMSFTAPAVSVDAENKTQNGNELYMGLFLPMNSRYWAGNLRKFMFGDPEQGQYLWGIYAGDGERATEIYYDEDGEELPPEPSDEYRNDAVGFWKVDGVNRTTSNLSGISIMEDGAGEVLTNRVINNFGTTPYERKIKIVSESDGVSLVDLSTNATNERLAIEDDALRAKIINWTYGFTFDGTLNDPVGPRDWALGPIVHSRPIVLDYYNSTNASVLENRYLAIGAGDGMLHIFDDTDGAELLAFVPNDALKKLQRFDIDQIDTSYEELLVDGEITLVYHAVTTTDPTTSVKTTVSQPKYLIFSQRRGGSSVICLDVEDPEPTNWQLAWEFNDDEMAESWSSVETAKIQTGTDTYTSVAIFTGGYDKIEDNFPEPFSDLNNNGTPDGGEWSNSTDDIGTDNNSYDTHNINGDTVGRALFVIALQNCTLNGTDYVAGDLIYSMKHCPSDGTESLSGLAQTSKLFQYCFPAGPSVVVGESNGHASVLKALYTVDIYGNIFRFDYNYNSGSGTWSMNHVFSVNPGSLSTSGTMAGGADNAEPWRKVFYAPSVSWKGSGYFFDMTNYIYDNVTFENTQNIASLFFGTGDREHPSYNLAHDRVYAVYDDTIVTAQNTTTSGPIAVSSSPYTEDDLLNLTCDELGIHTTQAGESSAGTSEYKTGLEALLTDDVLNQNETPLPMELDGGGNGENDAKGWYVILDQQVAGSYCDHCDYKATIQNTLASDRDNHFGEKIFSRITLYAGSLYFTSYQPSFDDPCAPEGNGLTYALNYLNASATENFNTANDDPSTDADPNNDDDDVTEQYDITDRYKKFTGISALPAELSPVNRDGSTYIPGLGVLKDIDRPIYYWIEK